MSGVRSTKAVEPALTLEEVRRQRQEHHDVVRWAEVSLWPKVRAHFLRWYEDRKPPIPERDNIRQPDPKNLLFMEFFRETGGDYRRETEATPDA